MGVLERPSRSAQHAAHQQPCCAISRAEKHLRDATCVPFNLALAFARASAPIIAPPARGTSGSKLAAVASEDGKAVLGIRLLRTPIEASVWV